MQCLTHPGNHDPPQAQRHVCAGLFGLKVRHLFGGIFNTQKTGQLDPPPAVSGIRPRRI